MKQVLLTTLKNKSSIINNIIWDSYLDCKNSFSLNKFIDQNSKYYKKKSLNELQVIYDLISKNKFIKKKTILDNKFNFLDTYLFSEKNFYKDKYRNLTDLIKVLALIDKIEDFKTKEIIFDIDNRNVYFVLKKYCDLKNIKLRINFSIYFKLIFFKIKCFIKYIYGLLIFLKFVFRRFQLPKNKNNYSINKKNLIFDYLSYFDHKKFISGSYKSNYWGNLFEKTKLNNDVLFIHLYNENCKLSNKELKLSLDKFKSKNKDQHLIIDTEFNLKIFYKILIKWFQFIFNFFIVKKKIENLFDKKKIKTHYLFRQSLYENSIGFDGLLNLYYYYLFENFFEKNLVNIKDKNILYLCENQGWEKSLLSFLKNLKKTIKVYPIVTTPIRFWDLRYCYLRHELDNFNKIITKFCTMSAHSKKMLIENKIDTKNIQIVESLRYEHLSKRFKRSKLLKTGFNKVLILGDYLHSTNYYLEKFSLNLLKNNHKLNFIAKPHPSQKFSKSFMNNTKIKLSNRNLDELAYYSHICISSSMTSASYDLFYLNFHVYILLTNDVINFSPLKNFKGVKYIYNLDEIIKNNINKNKNKKFKNKNFKKNALFFNKNYKSWRYILNG